MKTNENIEKLYKSELRDFESDMLSDSKIKNMWEAVSNKIETPQFSTDNQTNSVKSSLKSGSKASFFTKSNILVITSTSILTLAVAFFISQNINSIPEQQPANHTSVIPVSGELTENVYEEVQDEEAVIFHESDNAPVSDETSTSKEILKEEKIIPEQNKETIQVNPAKEVQNLHKDNIDDAVNNLLEKPSSDINGTQSKSKQVVITKEVKDTIQRVEKLRVDPRKYKGKKK